jgi:hypothetical protein
MQIHVRKGGKLEKWFFVCIFIQQTQKYVRSRNNSFPDLGAG